MLEITGLSGKVEMGAAVNENQWLECADPQKMLEFLERKASDRKLRLLDVASCHRIWSMMPVACQGLTNVLERYADGLATSTEYEAAWERADAEALAADRDPPDTLTYATASAGISNPPTVPSVLSGMDTAASAKACATAESAPEGEYDTTHDAARKKERYEQVRLIQDIFGNPFSSVTLDPSWVTPTVLALAQAIYTDRRFEDMPILGDCLEAVGCVSEDILNHCRGQGPHTRGVG
jgi:hypothetical protein